MHPEDLEGLRARIDDLNARLVDLLNERARCAERIAACKARQGLPVYDSRREQEVLDQVAARNQGPLSDEALRRIFAAIMEEHRRLQEERKEIYPRDGMA